MKDKEKSTPDQDTSTPKDERSLYQRLMDAPEKPWKKEVSVTFFHKPSKAIEGSSEKNMPEK